MASGHYTRRIFCKQLVWSFFVVAVVLQVSASYSRMGYTFEFNNMLTMSTLEQVVISWDFQMFLSPMKAALAFPIRVFTSTSVPPCWLITLPRYVNVSASSRELPFSVTGSLLRCPRAQPSCPQSPGHPALSRESTGCRSSFPVLSLSSPSSGLVELERVREGINDVPQSIATPNGLEQW